MIDRNKILAMLDHWFNSEINGYVGSPYGPDLNSLLMGPLDSPPAYLRYADAGYLCKLVKSGQ